MHIYTLHQWQHPHRFDADDDEGERNTHRVILLTVVMMVTEIAAGAAFGSMALLADGWHMGTHGRTGYHRAGLLVRPSPQGRPAV